MELKSKISTLKGVGEKTEKLLNRLGIYTIGDLLEYYPRNYDIYEEPVFPEEVLLFTQRGRHQSGRRASQLFPADRSNETVIFPIPFRFTCCSQWNDRRSLAINVFTISYTE